MGKTRADIRVGIRDKLNAWPDLTTTLNGTIDSVVTALNLTTASGLSDRFLLEIESEILQVRSFSGTSITLCVRGFRGTSAAVHGSGVPVNGFPFWGWTDTQLNRLISKAIAWLGEGMCWTLVPQTNTWLADKREFGLPAGAIYPTGNIVKRIEMLNDQGLYEEIAGWRHMGDRIITNKKLDKNQSVRIWLQTKQADLTDDSTQLGEDKWLEVIELYASGRALDELLANRSRYYEYAASLNDRASTADELQRAAYFFFNQATILRDQMSRPGLSGFAPIIRL